ncbi:MAG: zinc-binding dehydrogenase [Clostridiales bacterium]|nr:zinc-binding dehydrogenase [Clostridiales bacterium]
MSKTTQAVFRTGRGEVVIRDMAVPEPDSKQVLLRVKASLISPGTETAPIRRSRQQPKDAGMDQTGYCVAGVVEKVGAEISTLKEGDRIIAIEWGRAYHSPYVVLSGNMPVKIPYGIPFEDAVFVSLAATGLHAVRRVQPQLGEVMVIYGDGLIGQFASQFARLSGCRVVMAGHHEHRLAIAKRLGAELTLNPEQTDPVAAVMEFTDNLGADTGIIAFGGNGTAAFEQLVKMMVTPPDGQKVGRISITGMCDVTMSCGNFIGNINIFGATKGGAGYRDEEFHRGALYPRGYVRWTVTANLAEILREMHAGLFSVAPLLSHRIPFAEAPKGYEALITDPDSALGVVITYE